MSIITFVSELTQREKGVSRHRDEGAVLRTGKRNLQSGVDQHYRHM